MSSLYLSSLMLGCEAIDSINCIFQRVGISAKHDSEKRRSLKNGAWENKNGFETIERFDKLDVI